LVSSTWWVIFVSFGRITQRKNPSNPFTISLFNLALEMQFSVENLKSR